MKKIFALGLGILMFASCSSDDSSSVSTSKLTNKKWYNSHYVVLGQTIPYENENVDCGRDYSFFKDNGVLEAAYYNSNCDLYIDTSAWILEGKKLSISDEDGADTFTITKLTDSKLEVTAKVDYDDDGVEETMKMVFTSN